MKSTTLLICLSILLILSGKSYQQVDFLEQAETISKLLKSFVEPNKSEINTSNELENLDLSQLRILATNLEKHIYEGKEDFQKYFENIQKKLIIDYIKKKANENKKANDFLEQYFKNNSTDNTKPIVIGGGIHDYLINKDREYITKLALTIEKYHKKQTGRSDTLGGLHDFIFKMSEHDIREYIIQMTNKYPELQDIKKLEQLMTENLNFKFRKLSPIDIGGVHDYLIGKDREFLTNLALAVEKYHKKQTGHSDARGGLHDYIFRMSEHDIREYIIKMTNIYPELQDIKKLNELIAEKLVFLEKPIEIGGGIHDYLIGKDREYLTKLALTLEKYHKKETGRSETLGGLHDYIFKMSEHDIRGYIIKITNKYPELQNFQKIEELMEEYSNTNKHKFDKDSVSFLENIDGFKIDLKIDNLLKEMTRDDLENTAYATEKYIKKKNNMEDSIGGLHDFIWRMDDEQLKLHIIKNIRNNPELNNIDKLKAITEEYLEFINKHYYEEVIVDRFSFLGNIKNLDKKICKSIKKILKKSDLKQLTEIFKTISKIIKTPLEADSEAEIKNLSEKELRRNIEKLIEKHHDVLNNPEIFLKHN